jgi:DNA polymerase III subunit epsilon
MVSRAPAAAPALQAFLAFARGCVLVAHNAPFDLGFLTAACTACGISWPPAATIDTAVLARLLLGPEDVPDCRLATLATYFGTRTSPCHRALADAKATAGVLAGLLDLAANGRHAPARMQLAS